MKARAARTRQEAEDSLLWMTARIAASVVGVPGRRDPKKERVLEKDGEDIRRLKSLSSVWQLRADMQEHKAGVGSRADGEPLTYSHFFFALGADKPAEMVRRAVRENLSPSEVLALSNEELRQHKDRRCQNYMKAMGWD